VPPQAAATTDARPSAEDARPTELTDAERAADKALAPKVEAILAAFGNFDPRFSPDGKRVAFRSNRDGVPELFVGDVAKPEAAPIKIVPGPERVAEAAWTRDGKYILFLRDQGADENFRVYRVKPDGSDLQTLTPGETLHRDAILLPRKQPGTFVVSARKTTSPETTVYVGRVEGGAPKAVATDAGPSFAADVTPDATRALLIRFASPTNQVVLEADLASGKVRRVFPAEGKSAGVSAAAYSADGKRILLATDEGGERSALLALDGSTLAEKVRWAVDRPASARIDAIVVSPRGDRVAVNVDAGENVEVRLLDATTLAQKTSLLTPLGAVTADDFSDDGKSLALTESLPGRPADIHRADTATGATKPLRNDPRPGLADLPALAVSQTTIPAHDGLPIPVHAYLPKDLPSGGRLPVIVHFHGGPAASSVIAWNWMARFFTSQGFAFVEPNIRGSTGFGRAYEMADNREKRKDAIKDLETVNAWVKAQPWCDPGRVVIYGGSYGGYLVLMGLTRQPDKWAAGVDFVGVANLFTFLKSTDQAIRTAFVDEFGDLDKDAALLDEFSPMRQKDAIAAPLFVYQGQNDPRVPRGESDQVVASLRGRHVPVEYMVAANEGHSLDRRENRVAFLTRVVRFLGATMGKSKK
jgi:dipeptidyl aminopeptidase/acylaminoacyl peptidase